MRKLKIIRTVFQECESREGCADSGPKLVLVLDMESQIDVSTKDIPGIIGKIETALPGLFPDCDSDTSHSCGGVGSDVDVHSFREEMQQGTSIPHLLEHIVMYLLSRSSNHCGAYCGQRSSDIEAGITSHYYLVFDCISQIAGVVAVDVGFQLISAWVAGKSVRIDPDVVLNSVSDAVAPMFGTAA